MIPKENRLKKKKEFNFVFQKGRSVNGRYVRIKYKELKGKKIGFVAPVKEFRKATERNKVKRKLRESFRKFIPNLKDDIGIIVIAKKDIEVKNVEEVGEIMEKILIKHKLLKR